MTLEETLTSRDNVNPQLRVVLDEATGRWGIRVNRVELKSVEPPRTVQEAMEKQMRAERDRRATILTAEGVKQSQILTAEGEKQAAVLRAEGAAHGGDPAAPRARRRRSRPSSSAIHDGAPDQELLCYQYLQMLPQLAQGEANKIFVIPSEFTQALGNIGSALGRFGGGDEAAAAEAARRAAARRDRREGPGAPPRRRRRAGDAEAEAPRPTAGVAPRPRQSRLPATADAGRLAVAAALAAPR